MTPVGTETVIAPACEPTVTGWETATNAGSSSVLTMTACRIPR